MLVLSREVGTAIIIDVAGETATITVLKLDPRHRSIFVRIAGREWGDGRPLAEPVEVSADAPVDIGNDVHLSLVDLRESKARVGITAPSNAMVHRLEVYQDIQRENRAARRHGPEDGPAGAAVPRPTKPTPPSLPVRLDEPRPAEDDGG